MNTPNGLTAEGVTSNCNYNKRIQIMVSDEHLEMLKTIAMFYRIPNNLSHGIRLMIEDKFKEIE